MEAFWGPTDEGTNAAAWSNRSVVALLDGNGPTNLSLFTTGLTAGATNYYTFQFTSCRETLWAEPSGTVTNQFTTPEISNGSGADIDGGSAALNWNLLDGGGADITIYWGTTDGGVDPLAWNNAIPLGDRFEGEGSTAVTNLTYGQPYYYRAYVTNAAGEDWADATTLFKSEAMSFGIPRSNMVLWLDAENGPFSFTSNNYVSVWGDRSGTGNHATRDLNTNGTETAIQRITNAINGRATVEFNTGHFADNLEILPSLRIDTASGAPGGSAFVVAKTTDTDGNDPLMSGPSFNTFFGQDDGEVEFYNGTGVASISADHVTSNRVRYADFDVDRADRIRYVVNGTELGVNNSQNVAEDGYELNEVGEFWIGDIAEILIWDRVLSDEEQARVGLYLALKYGLDTAYETNGSFGINAHPAASVQATSAEARGELMALSAVADVWLYWGATDGGTNTAAWDNAVSIGSYTDTIETLSYSLTGLTPGVTYYYTFRATNCAADVWSTVEWFSPLSAPVVTFGPPIEVDEIDAQITTRLKQGEPADLFIYLDDQDRGTDAAAWSDVIPLGTGLYNGDYADTLFSLTYGVEYWYRTYATNGLGEDWSDTATNFFVDIFITDPILNPYVNDVTQTSAVFEATFWAPLSLYHAIVYWGTNDGGTNAAAWEHRSEVAVLTNGSETISFLANNLLPDTTYYVAWETTNRLTNIWEQPSLSFITIQPPLVDNGTGATPGINTAMLTANLLAGNEAELLIYWGRNDGGTNPAAWDNYIDLDTVINGSHTGLAERLVSCATYYYRAFAENNLGEAWASTSVVFQAIDSGFGVSNQPATDLTDISGRMNGTVDATGTIAHAWIYYGPTDGGTNAGSWANEVYFGTITDRVAQLSHQVAGLSSNETRFYTFRASNCLGEAWASPTESFTITAGSYSNRLRIGFCAYSGSETLTNFPVLVKLGSHIAGFD
ncbi:MAG: hypothetical protein AAF492_04290, partial [Verrucomicrobiota bacterium]